jgi:hypothetical protein
MANQNTATPIGLISRNPAIRHAQLTSRIDKYQGMIVDLEGQMTNLMGQAQNSAPAFGAQNMDELNDDFKIINEGFDNWWKEVTDSEGKGGISDQKDAAYADKGRFAEEGVRDLAQAITDYPKNVDGDANLQMAAVRSALAKIKAALGETRNQAQSEKDNTREQKEARKRQGEIAKL